MTLKLKRKDNHAMPQGKRIGLIPCILMYLSVIYLYSLWFVFRCDFFEGHVVRVNR